MTINPARVTVDALRVVVDAATRTSHAERDAVEADSVVVDASRPEMRLASVTVEAESVVVLASSPVIRIAIVPVDGPKSVSGTHVPPFVTPLTQVPVDRTNPAAQADDMPLVPPPVALMVTAPVPPAGVIVIPVPAKICVTATVATVDACFLHDPEML